MKIKLAQSPPRWKRIMRHKAQELQGEFLEMALGYFITSEAANFAVEQIHTALVRNLLHLLQSNNNALGVLRVLLPLLIFVAFFFLRRLAAHFIKLGAQTYQRVRARIAAKRRLLAESDEAI